MALAASWGRLKSGLNVAESSAALGLHVDRTRFTRGEPGCSDAVAETQSPRALWRSSPRDFEQSFLASGSPRDRRKEDLP